MKIQLLSDLHLESGKIAENWEIPMTDADAIVLAGDISVGTKGIRWAVSEARRLSKPIIYVMGNHEYYHYEMTSLLEEAKEIATSSGVVHLLDNNAVEINGVRFLGCTLWTDYACDPDTSQSSAMVVAGERLNDHSLITYNRRQFQPADALNLHLHSRRWLADQLDQPFSGPTVVVTHHAPSLTAQHPKFPTNALTGAFLSDMSDLMTDNVAAWFFGHTHYSLDTHLNGVHLMSNQGGYNGEDTGRYHPERIIEIEPR